jgi:CO dehydrogenase/acetyl-CoA synthase gamma subunit (corrinoid Fe-S protein)
MRLLEGTFTDGETVEVDVTGGQLAFEKAKAHAASSVA